MRHYQAIIDTPIGKLGIQADEAYLYRIDFLPKEARVQSPQTFAAELTCHQLQSYFQNPRHVFELPCELSVTPVQRRILDELCLIPLGKAYTYGEIAKKARTGARVVGTACRCNPLPIVIPCHRVIAKGKIGGYGGVTQGPSIDMKRWLLGHEGWECGGNSFG